MSGYMQWPAARNSYGYIPPEVPVEVTTSVFGDMLRVAPIEAWPPWWIEPFARASSHVLMLAGTMYKLCAMEIPLSMQTNSETRQ